MAMEKCSFFHLWQEKINSNSLRQSAKFAGDFPMLLQRLCQSAPINVGIVI